MKRFMLGAMITIVAIAAVLTGTWDRVDARTAYLDEFTAIYLDAAGTKLDDCITCHSELVTYTRNSYGATIEYHLGLGKDINTAITNSDGDDSDLDSYANYEEIWAVTFPGDASDYPCRDLDSDGYTVFWFCSGPTGDCNDNDPTMSPGIAEVCDGVKDNDCDGLSDVEDPDCAGYFCTDADGDGYAVEGGECGPADCDDTDTGTHPGACDIRKDGIDQDCSGRDRTSGPPCP